ncbi:MAG: hypothetical protein HOM01_12255, partial [Kordiimonadaceae bacterium]|nr:hypothetical protein [Kordiimonadaceae bacterium]
MAGEKKSYVTSDATMGKTDTDIHGLEVQTVNKTAPIAGLNGDEVFTINISTSSTAQDDIVIDLSDISGDVTLESITNLINSNISAVTTVNAANETVSKYKTRVQIDELSEGHFGLTFDVDGIEKLSFSAAASTPALIIAGTTKSSDYGSVETGSISKYTNLDGTGLSKSYSHEIVGIDEEGFVIPADSSVEDSEETKSTSQTLETTPVAIKVDSQGNSYVVGTTQGNIDGQ